MGLKETERKGDYFDLIAINESDIIPLLEPAENFIKTIEQLILTT
jgi:hypothetical protein